MQSNSLLIVPSLDEGFGNLPVEGMLSKIPVLSSNRASLPEVVKDNGLLFDLKNINDAADKAIRLLTDKKLANELTKKAAKYADSFLNKEQTDIIIETYKDSLK